MLAVGEDIQVHQDTKSNVQIHCRLLSVTPSLMHFTIPPTTIQEGL